MFRLKSYILSLYTSTLSTIKLCKSVHLIKCYVGKYYARIKSSNRGFLCREFRLNKLIYENIKYKLYTGNAR